MLKTLLILKPECLRKGLVGRVLHIIEMANMCVEDGFCMVLKPEDVYDFYAEQIHYPTPEAVKTFLGGNSLILMIVHQQAPFYLAELHRSLIKDFADVYVSANDERAEKDIAFWFGEK